LHFTKSMHLTAPHHLWRTTTMSVRLAAAALIAIAAAAGHVRAQAPAGRTVRVNVLRPITFGITHAGGTLRADPTRHPGVGIFEVLGAGGQSVELAFALPAAMMDERGTSLPMDFDGISAAMSPSQSMSDATPLDPRLRTVVTLPPSGRLLVFLGGRLSASAGQRTAQYAATIALTVTPVP
jgi:hypothetical protein